MMILIITQAFIDICLIVWAVILIGKETDNVNNEIKVAKELSILRKSNAEHTKALEQMVSILEEQQRRLDNATNAMYMHDSRRIEKNPGAK